MAAGIDANMQPVALAFLRQRFQHVNVAERLAAGERDAAAGLLVKHLVGEQLRQQLGGGKGPAGDLPRVLQAVVDAVAAGAAQVAVGESIGRDGLLRAVRLAAQALRAFFGVMQQFGPVTLALRVVAPAAAQRAAFEEYGSADAGAVVDREFLQGQPQRNRLCHWPAPLSKNGLGVPTTRSRTILEV